MMMSFKVYCELVTILCVTSCLSAKSSSLYDLSATDIDGNDVKFDAFKGKVILIVNVASRCGYTDGHYTQLQRMFDILGQGDHFIILAFPCNQFGAQEPGSNEEIKEFVEDKYKVTFPVFSKIDVDGQKASPIWKKIIGLSGVAPEWNFYKYLFDHKGNIIEVYPPGVSVESMFDTVSKAIKKAKKATGGKSKKSVKKDLKEEL